MPYSMKFSQIFHQNSLKMLNDSKNHFAFLVDEFPGLKVVL